MKTCFKCGEEKPLSDFYKHNQMSDDHLNKCKLCAKGDSTKRRWSKVEEVRAYDRARGNRQSKAYFNEYKLKYPNKYKAHNMVSNAVRDKKLFKECCEVCGDSKVEAHHDDYLKPLNVRWLCPAHHKQWHRDNGEGLNSN